MNKNQAKGNWNQLKGEIKKRWGALTDDDLMEAEGDMQKLAGKIQKKTGDDQQAIERWLHDHHAS
ncbi:MAG TPA: CsbD family protein [Candidatus Binataceae bacterium]|nr:CsbD family protein [Candidatus Binataceae bacterium]